MWYNVRVKTYADGHDQYFWSENLILRDIPEEFRPKKVKKLKIPGSQSERGKRNSLKRAIQNVYDLARCNQFDWFITLTFDGNKVNRYDYDACADAIKMFTNRLRKYGCRWLIVPEQHKDGAYHFHGMVSGSLPLIPSGRTCYNEVSGETLEIYNLANYEFGFTTATRIVHPEKTASYIAKYLTKEIAVPKGRKCYWASKSLVRPAVSYVEMDDDDFFWNIYMNARYTKEIEGSYGKFLLAEE